MRTVPAAAATITVALLVAAATIPAAAQTASPPRVMDPSLVRYDDAVGDVAGGPGPDIVAVSVSQPDSEHVSIGVEMAADPPVGFSLTDDPYWTDMLVVFIGTTPEGLGVRPDSIETDYWMGLHGATLDRHLAQGVDLYSDDEVLEGAVEVAVDGPTLTLTLARHDLGAPDGVVLIVAAAREVGNGEEGGGEDIVPENDGAGPATVMAWEFPPA